MQIYGPEDRYQNSEELEVILRGLSRVQQISAFIISERPIQVLAASIDTGERLFMEQADEIVPDCYLLHDLH